MRTETDRFEDENGFSIDAECFCSDIEFHCIDDFGGYVVTLDKDQARKFFKQGLEMCGDPEAAEQITKLQAEKAELMGLMRAYLSEYGYRTDVSSDFYERLCKSSVLNKLMTY